MSPDGPIHPPADALVAAIHTSEADFDPIGSAAWSCSRVAQEGLEKPARSQGDLVVETRARRADDCRDVLLFTPAARRCLAGHRGALESCTMASISLYTGPCRACSVSSRLCVRISCSMTLRSAVQSVLAIQSSKY